MGLASSKNKNVIRFLLRWIYMFLLELQFAVLWREAVWKSTFVLQMLQSNLESSRWQHSLWPAGFWVCETRLSGAGLPLSDPLPVPRAAAACAEIPIPTNLWAWRLAVSVGQAHLCHSTQFTELKWAMWSVPPPRCCAHQGGWIGSSMQGSDGKTKTIKHSQWLQHLSCTFCFHWTSWTGRLHTLAQKYCMLLYVLFWLFQSGLFFRLFPRKFIPTSAFSHLHFCSLLHVACTYCQVFQV